MASKVKDKIFRKAQVYLDDIEDTDDKDLALAFARLFIDKTLKFDVLHSGETSFLKTDRKRKCCRCGEFYAKNEYIFLCDSEGWHPHCATEEEKASNNGWKAKGLLVPTTDPKTLVKGKSATGKRIDDPTLAPEYQPYNPDTKYDAGS